MFPTLLALTAALSSPAQFKETVRKPSFLPPYEELDALCHEASDVQTRLSRELTRVVLLCEDIERKEEGASFQRRLSLLRDYLSVADEAARLTIPRQERFDRAYQRNPLKVARDVFKDSQREIVKLRTLARTAIYGQIHTHRWPWEAAKELPFLNGQIMNTLAKACGMENETEKFRHRMAAVEICATDTYRAVAGGVEALLNGLPKLPSLPRPFGR